MVDTYQTHLLVREIIEELENLRFNMIFNESEDWEVINKDPKMTALYLMIQADIQRASATLRLLNVELEEQTNA